MEIEIRFFYSMDCKDKIINHISKIKGLKFKGRFYECTDQYNHPMKEYDFYSKEIDGRFRVRKTIGDNYYHSMITWKKRTGKKEKIHKEEEVEVSINEEDYDNLVFLLQNVLHLELVESYERYRSVFSNKDIEIVVDEYPFGICIEIENKSKDKDPVELVAKWTKKIGLNIEDAYPLSWDDKYKELCITQKKKIESIVRFDKDMPIIKDLFN